MINCVIIGSGTVLQAQGVVSNSYTRLCPYRVGKLSWTELDSRTTMNTQSGAVVLPKPYPISGRCSGSPEPKAGDSGDTGQLNLNYRKPLCDKFSGVPVARLVSTAWINLVIAQLRPVDYESLKSMKNPNSDRTGRFEPYSQTGYGKDPPPPSQEVNPQRKETP